MKKLSEKPALRELLTRAGIGLLAAILLLALALYAGSGNAGYTNTRYTGVEYEKARVLSVAEDNTRETPDYENIRVGAQTLELELLSGRYRGDIVTVKNALTAYHNSNVLAEPGMTLSVRVSTSGDNDYTVAVYNYDRGPWLWIFAGIFLLALILVGGRQGLAAVFGLLFTMAAMIFVLLPLLTRRGWSPVPATLLLVALTMFVSYVFIGGLHIKSMTAALGAFAGVLLAGLFAFLAGKIVRINGVNMDEAEELYLVARDNGVGLKVSRLLVCGILISAEGAIMDIAMSVSSTVEEVHRVSPDMTPKALFRSGMHVGRDAMGTMANTLILAFTGTALNTMLLASAYDISYGQLISSEWITMEVIRALAGSAGMVLTVPAVAAVAAFLFAGKQKSKHKKGEIPC